MRVCHVGFNFFPGQGLTIFYEFSRHQAKQGLDVTVIAPGRAGEPIFEIIDNVRVHRIPLHSIGRFSLDRFRFLWCAAKIIQAGDFDLVHSYAFVGVGVIPLICRKNKTKWLYDCQTSAIKPPWLGLQNWLIWFESLSYDVVTVLSFGIREIVFGKNSKIDLIVPLGADFDHFYPRPPDKVLQDKLGISKNNCVLTYCGTLDHNRRMERLIDAFSMTASQDETVILLLVGDGSALSDLKVQVVRLGLQNRVIFTGYVPYREIPSYLSVTTIALAFIAKEPYFEHQPPTKTVEYLAQGLPVLATDTAGNRIFITHGENGFLCGDSAVSYSQAMLDIVHSSNFRLRLVSRARASVKEFDWSEIVRSVVIKNYHQLLCEQPSDKPRFE